MKILKIIVEEDDYGNGTVWADIDGERQEIYWDGSAQDCPEDLIWCRDVSELFWQAFALGREVGLGKMQLAEEG